MFFHGPLEHISSGMGWSFNWSNAIPKQVTTGSVWGFYDTDLVILLAWREWFLGELGMAEH